MQLIKKYIAYLKNNPEHYWFKRKPFGWGWTPVTWQGWTASSIAVALIVLISIHSSEETQAVTFIEVAVIFGIFLWICFKTGEKPRWEWGFPKDERKDQEND